MDDKTTRSNIDKELIEDALKLLNEPSEDLGTSMASKQGEAPEEKQSGTASPTLERLESDRLPKEKTACETCPNSVWFASSVELKCYCRVMYLVTWSTRDPNQITSCDGAFIGQD